MTNMTTSITRLTLLVFISAALASAPLQSQAQTTNKAPVDKTAGSQGAEATKPEKPGKAGPFHGKLAAVDKVAKTITVGKRTFQITSETRIKKAGKPATMDDGVVGETVSGYVKPASDGKLAATTVNFGPKPAPQESEKPKAATPADKQPKQAQPQ
jgi:hypothetical protein